MQPTGRLNFCTALLITLTLTPAVNAAPLWLDCTVHDNPHQMMLLVAGDQCLFPLWRDTTRKGQWFVTRSLPVSDQSLLRLD